MRVCVCYSVAGKCNLGFVSVCVSRLATNQKFPPLFIDPSAPYVLRHDDWATKQRFATEIASGMALVHSLGRIHRDLKSGNILATLTQNVVRVKVSDFGTATLAGHYSATQPQAASASYAPLTQAQLTMTQLHGHTKCVGTPFWMAPELLAGKLYNQSADIYSYGILLWEIASHAYPWKDVASLTTTNFFMAALLEMIESGQRPPIQDTWSPLFVSTMTACWATDPNERPKFSNLWKQ